MKVVVVSLAVISLTIILAHYIGLVAGCLAGFLFSLIVTDILNIIKL